MALLAFLIHNDWLVLATGILFILGAFSMKLNFIYQLHNFFSRKVLKEETAVIQKDSGELRFVYSFTGILFLISFFLIYYAMLANLGWGLDLLVSFLTLLASFANLCLASLLYVSFKKVFNR
jgi:hypothetical protein